MAGIIGYGNRKLKPTKPLDAGLLAPPKTDQAPPPTPPEEQAVISDPSGSEKWGGQLPVPGPVISDPSGSEKFPVPNPTSGTPPISDPRGTEPFPAQPPTQAPELPPPDVTPAPVPTNGAPISDPSRPVPPPTSTPTGLIDNARAKPMPLAEAGTAPREETAMPAVERGSTEGETIATGLMPPVEPGEKPAPAPTPPPELHGANLALWYQQNGIPPPPGSNTGTGVLGSDGTIANGGSGTDFSGAGTTGAPGTTAWTPTTGIVNQIRGITPQTINGSSYDPTAIDPATQANANGYGATGYTAAQAPDATGYDAHGYDAAHVGENLSGAIGRITGEDGILMQRAKFLADQKSNERGLSNSSMAVGAAQGAVLDKASEIGQGDVNVGMFNAQATNDARKFMADAGNVAAQFLAAEKNNNGRFNAEQANQASAFTANATNTASQFEASAKNAASMFNAGEANKRALASAEFANQAKQFAAQMDQASKEFNATAFNQAQQRYTDAMNAAIAAQNDAENLAKRDTAQINADLLKTKMGLGVQQQIASGNNAANIAGANINAQAAAARQGSEIDARFKELGLTLSQRDREFTAGLSATQFNQFQQGLNAGMLTEMEPGARQNWLNNYMSVWSASGSLPFGINMDHFPPAGTTTTPPPPGNPPPPGTTTNPVGR